VPDFAVGDNEDGKVFAACPSGILMKH
jgi:hypothetical protein